MLHSIIEKNTNKVLENLQTYWHYRKLGHQNDSDEKKKNLRCNSTKFMALIFRCAYHTGEPRGWCLSLNVSMAPAFTLKYIFFITFNVDALKNYVVVCAKTNGHVTKGKASQGAPQQTTIFCFVISLTTDYCWLLPDRKVQKEGSSILLYEYFYFIFYLL